LKFLVDANVLSEATRPAPSEKVIDWLRVNESDLVIDAIILGEIRFGILLLPGGNRRRRLEAWFDAGIANFTCLAWESETALVWAVLLARLRHSGRSMPIKDSLIAATAIRHDLTIATRNGPDFSAARVRLIDPFR
jgi:hypothetical protein